MIGRLWISNQNKIISILKTSTNPKELPKDRSSVAGIPTTKLAKAVEREEEPKRSIVDRILDRAPVAATTKTKDLDREMERSKELER